MKNKTDSNIRKVINEVIKDYKNKPLEYLNEMEVVSSLVERLRKIYPEQIEVDFEPDERYKANNKYSISRIRQECGVPIPEKERDGKVDIFILHPQVKGKKIGFYKKVVWSSRTPGAYFHQEDVLAAIEVKHHRSPNKKSHTKTEITGLDNNVEALASLKNIKYKYLLLISLYEPEQVFIKYYEDILENHEDIILITKHVWDKKDKKQNA